jgi:hypothetical protein
MRTRRQAPGAQSPATAPIGWLSGAQECSDFRLSTDFIQHDGFSSDSFEMKTAAEGYRLLIG